MSRIIALHEPSILGNEWQYIKECLDSTWISTAGKYVNLFEGKISEYTGSKFAVACVNGTSALQVSLLLSGVQPGDEVIVPALTFIAPVNVIAYNSANPIFMDADEYYNIDTEKTIEFIKNETVFKDGFTFNKTTKKKITAIIPVHVWGNACLLENLVELCTERNIAILEDASESLGSIYTSGKYKGRHTGNVGLLGCMSFNGNKIITTGGGGMILTDDEEIAEKARHLTTQAKDDPIRYVHHEIGYNFRLTNIQAALGLAQLEQLPEFLKRKKDIYRQYAEALEKIEGLSLVNVPEYAENNHWLNLLKIDSETYGVDREALMAQMEQNGIQTRPVWALNHLQKPYRNCQGYKIERAEVLVNNSLCLPSSSNLSNSEIKKVIDILHG